MIQIADYRDHYTPFINNCITHTLPYTNIGFYECRWDPLALDFPVPAQDARIYPYMEELDLR